MSSWATASSLTRRPSPSIAALGANTDVIGIDTGISMLMAENLRTSFVWNTFMKSSEAERGLERAGLKSYAVDYRKIQEELEARTR